MRPVGAKAVDAALLLARSTVPEPMRPGWEAALAMAASRIPHQRLVALDARLAMAAGKPVIVPDTVVIDHGKVFVSELRLHQALAPAPAVMMEFITAAWMAQSITVAADLRIADALAEKRRLVQIGLAPDW